MKNQASLQETKQHGALRFPFNIYPCTIPGDFPQVALHWHENMELVFVKRGEGIIQVGTESYPAQMGDIFIFVPGTLHALRQAGDQTMEYENIIFDLELLGGTDDLCAEKYLLPLQSGRLPLPEHLVKGDPSYRRAAACLREIEEVNRTRFSGYELIIKADLLHFLAVLIQEEKSRLPAETADTLRLKTILQWLSAHYTEALRVEDAAEVCSFSSSHFMRWFRQMTGQSFIAFLNDYRLNLAADALRTTDDSILAIATACGFANLSYFNRAFKAHFQMPPRAYRKRQENARL